MEKTLKRKDHVKNIGMAFLGAFLLASCSSADNTESSGSGFEYPESTQTDFMNESVDANRSTPAESTENTAQSEEITVEKSGFYLRDDFTAKDYIALAEQYKEADFYKKQRDTLEQAYRIFGETSILEQLSQIFINLDEEEKEIAELGKLMLQNIELEEYRAECLHMLEENSWFTTMMPKLAEGKRNYFIQKGGKLKLLLTVGYRDNGAKYTDVFYFENEKEMIYMGYSGRNAQIMECAINGEKYDGSFLLWTMEGTTGNMIKESGNFRDGSCEKDTFLMEFYKGSFPVDVYDLWSNKDNFKYRKADITADPPKGSRLSIVPNPPHVEVYEVAGNDFGEENSRVRLFDGELQLLTEDGWIFLGNMEDITEEEVFQNYAEEKLKKDAEEIYPEITVSEPEPEKQGDTTQPEQPQSSEQETDPDPDQQEEDHQPDSGDETEIPWGDLL